MLLTDLSKAFDCLRHDSFLNKTVKTAKLVACGTDQQSLCLIFSYLADIIQRTEVSNTNNSYTIIKYGAPQCSILDPLLFNIDICDLFLWVYKCGIDGYTGDKIPYTSAISFNLVLEKFESLTHDFFGWFKEKLMKTNAD